MTVLAKRLCLAFVLLHAGTSTLADDTARGSAAFARLAYGVAYPVLADAAAEPSVPASDAPNRQPPAGRVLFVAGVPGNARADTLRAVDEVFGTRAVSELIELTGDELPDRARDRIGTASLIVALGRDACAAVASSAAATADVICTLLYRDAWQSIDCTEPCATLHALLLDPPLHRQVAVTRALYPALQRFGVLSRDIDSVDDPRVMVREPPEDGRVAAIFEQLAIDNDAIVAVAEPDLYDADTLRIALLSAYGRGRPVIAFGPEFVRAGALLGVWSTPRDVLEQLHDLLADAQLWDEDAGRSQAARRRLFALFDERNTLDATRFHLATNEAVARSLGLAATVPAPGPSYTDRDFAR